MSNVARSISQTPDELSIPDLGVLIGALVVLASFLLLPFSGGSNGLTLLSEAFASEAPGLGAAIAWMIPGIIAAVVGGVAAALALFNPFVRSRTTVVIWVAGIVALVSLGLYGANIFIKNSSTFFATINIGFWLGLVIAIGLVGQVYIPRPVPAHVVGLSSAHGTQVSLKTIEAVTAFHFIAPFVILFCIFTIRAVVSAVGMSFYDWQILRPARPYIGFNNYAELFNDDVWWQALRNTIIYAIMTVVGTTTVALAAAMALTQKIKGTGFFRVLLYMPTLLSVGVVGLVWVWLLQSQFGVINYVLSFIGIRPINWLGDENIVLPALSLTTIWWGFGFPMLVFIAGLQNIPDTLYEAAKIDGGSGWQIFRHITLPLLRPTILFVTVTGLIARFQAFGEIFIMTTGGPGRASYTVIYYLYEIAWRNFRMGYGAAVAVTLALIMATVTAIQFRFIGRRVEY
jgi:multiple sugar transport system permease protein